MRGRKPKPVRQKMREGNAGKRQIRDLVISPGHVQPPPGLPADALELWNWLTARLEAVKVLDQVDQPALVAMVVQWARATQARRILDSEGWFELGSMGQLVEHPALQIERQAHALFLRFAEQYGLTAAARARISASLRPSDAIDRLREILDAAPTLVIDNNEAGDEQEVAVDAELADGE